MKKLFLILLGLVIIVVGLLYWRIKWVESRYEVDYITLENEILLPDTDGKGFSDKVKKEIDSTFKDPELRDRMYLVAKMNREIIRSKTFDIYRENTLKSFYPHSCLLFYIYEKKENEKWIENKDILFDNEDMKNYTEFLYLFKFRNKDLDIEYTDLINNNRIDSWEDYEKLCK